MYNSKIIIALDFNNKKEVFDFLKNFDDEKLFLKVGMELFYAEGNSIVKELKELGHNIFLDLKLYDIPTTVAKSIDSIGKLDVDFLTIHASGGSEMLKVAKEHADKYDINLLAVTVLTSQSKDELIKTDYEVIDIIDDLAKKVEEEKIYGIICSALDIENIKANNIKFVTPGIRNQGDNTNDQKRVMTPKKAIDAGSDFLVVGRSITQSSTPYQTYKNMLKEINE